MENKYESIRGSLLPAACGLYLESMVPRLHRRCMWNIFGKLITADILYIRCTLLTFSYSFSRTESKIKSHSVFSCLDLEVEDGWKTGIRER